MQCVTTISFLILIIGKRSSKFNLERGLRQEDPISSFLFLPVSDFSGLIRRAEEEGSISGLKIKRRCISISHLLFVDDVLLFLKPEEREARKLLDVLDVYCKPSG